MLAASYCSGLMQKALLRCTSGRSPLLLLDKCVPEPEPFACLASLVIGCRFISIDCYAFSCLFVFSLSCFVASLALVVVHYGISESWRRASRKRGRLRNKLGNYRRRVLSFSMQFMQTMCDFLLRKTIANRQHQSRRQRRETIAHQKRASLLSEIVILVRRKQVKKKQHHILFVSSIFSGRTREPSKTIVRYLLPFDRRPAISVFNWCNRLFRELYHRPAIFSRVRIFSCVSWLPLLIFCSFSLVCVCGGCGVVGTRCDSHIFSLPRDWISFERESKRFSRKYQK